MLGSSQSIAGPCIVLNTVVAEELEQFADALEGAQDFNAALNELIRKTIREHKRILFDGNGYDESWIAEAERRGLSNYRTTPEAMPHYVDEKNIALFSKHKVFHRGGDALALRGTPRKLLQGHTHRGADDGGDGAQGHHPGLVHLPEAAQRDGRRDKGSLPGRRLRDGDKICSSTCAATPTRSI